MFRRAASKGNRDRKVRRKKIEQYDTRDGCSEPRVSGRQEWSVVSNAAEMSQQKAVRGH